MDLTWLLLQHLFFKNGHSSVFSVLGQGFEGRGLGAEVWKQGFGDKGLGARIRRQVVGAGVWEQ